MAIKLEMLRVYATVVESGTLADAAERVGRTPAALSMALKQLEAELGGRLFESDRKRRLTPLGRFAYEETRRAITIFDEVVTSVRRFARGELGLVRVAAVPSVASQFLPAVVGRFHETRPQVDIEVRDIDSSSVLEAVRSGQVDVGLASMGAPAADLSCRPLMEERFGLVCRIDHPLADLERPIDWADLDPGDFIANGLCAQIAAPAFSPIVEGARLTVRNTTSLLAFVRQGLGTTILPKLATEGITPELCVLPLVDPTAVRTILMITVQRGAASPLVAEFIDHLATTAQRYPWYSGAHKANRKQ